MVPSQIIVWEGILISVLLMSCSASSQEMPLTEKIKTGSELIKLGCGIGSKKLEFDANVAADGSLTVKKLPGIEGSGSVKYNKKEVEGIAILLRNEINDNSYKLSEKQIDCMKPYIGRIFDEIFKPIDKKGTKIDEKKLQPLRQQVSTNEKSKSPKLEKDKLNAQGQSIPSTSTPKIAQRNKAIDVIFRSFGFRLGDVYGFGSGAAERVLVHNRVMSGQMNKFSLRLRRDQNYGIEIFTDENYIITAIEISNDTTAAFESNEFKNFYAAIVNGWGDFVPVNVTVTDRIPPSQYYPTYKDFFESNVREFGGIKYTYWVSRTYNKDFQTMKAESRMIFSL